jgi:hypothetical protein
VDGPVERGQRVLAGLLDAPEQRRRGGRIAAHDKPGLRCSDHLTDVMGDVVVQVPREPLPLRPARPRRDLFPPPVLTTQVQPDGDRSHGRQPPHAARPHRGEPRRRPGEPQDKKGDRRPGRTSTEHRHARRGPVRHPNYDHGQRRQLGEQRQQRHSPRRRRSAGAPLGHRHRDRTRGRDDRGRTYHSAPAPDDHQGSDDRKHRRGHRHHGCQP